MNFFDYPKRLYNKLFLSSAEKQQRNEELIEAFNFAIGYIDNPHYSKKLESILKYVGVDRVYNTPQQVVTATCKLYTEYYSEDVLLGLAVGFPLHKPPKLSSKLKKITKKLATIDPVTREEITSKDRVVVCKQCNTTYLKSSWKYLKFKCLNC